MSAENVSRTLDEVHEALREDFRQLDTAKAIVAGFHRAGLLTNEEARLRTLALEICPGHEACRVWCAYCGDLPESE